MVPALDRVCVVVLRNWREFVVILTEPDHVGSRGALCARFFGDVAPSLGISKEKCVGAAGFFPFSVS